MVKIYFTIILNLSFKDRKYNYCLVENIAEFNFLAEILKGTGLLILHIYIVGKNNSKCLNENTARL